MAGIYLHIPFCSRRCVYCDFYFVTTRKDHTSFIEAMCREIELHAPSWAEDSFRTVYFGGGTPSLLLLTEIDQILKGLRCSFDISQVDEITLELNPEDVTPAYLEGLLALGINRLSIGIQSFDRQTLSFMGRSHTSEQAHDIIPMVRDAGFSNFSVDLIFGVPGQNHSTWSQNLNQVLQLNVPHISTYGLTVEPGTILGKQVEKGNIMPVQEEGMQALYLQTMETLQQAGYEHYEISSFARPGCRSLHNQVYWKHENYLGLGPSAHSFRQPGQAMRWSNVRHLKTYEATLTRGRRPIENEELLDHQTLVNEYIMLRLRTSDGLDLEALQDRYQTDLFKLKSRDLDWLSNDGFIRWGAGQTISLTPRGKTVCDSVTRRLLI